MAFATAICKVSIAIGYHRSQTLKAIVEELVCDFSLVRLASFELRSLVALTTGEWVVQSSDVSESFGHPSATGYVSLNYPSCTLCSRSKRLFQPSKHEIQKRLPVSSVAFFWQ
jgi:hypothetical protein